jgi:hypothetical protein
VDIKSREINKFIANSNPELFSLSFSRAQISGFAELKKMKRLDHKLTIK